MNKMPDHTTGGGENERAQSGNKTEKSAPSGETLAGEERLATVLQVLPALGASGGVERGTVEIAGAVVEAGGRAIVASAGGPLVHDLARVGAEHFELPLDSKNPVTLWRNVDRLADLIRGDDYDHLIGCASIDLAGGLGQAHAICDRILARQPAPADCRVAPYRVLPQPGTREMAQSISLPPLIKAYLRIGARVGGAPGVCDEGVDFAEFFDYVCDETGYGLPVADVALVGFDFDAVFFGEFFGVLLAAFGTGCAVGGGVLVCVVGR